MGEGAKLKSLREEVQNFCPKTVNTRRGAAISTDDTIGDWTLPSNKHVHKKAKNNCSVRRGKSGL